MNQKQPKQPKQHKRYNPYQSKPTTAETFDTWLLVVLCLGALVLVGQSEVGITFLNQYVFKVK